MLLVTAQLGRMAVNETYLAPGPLALSRSVVIAPEGTAAAAAVLQQDGAISHPLVFRAAAWATRKQGKLHAGEFLLPARSSLHEILDILRFAPPVEHQVTIPEGLTGVQIAKILNAAGFAAGIVPPPPEGSVLPQTYNYTLGTQRAEIVSRAASAMQEALAKAWSQRDRTISLTAPDQALVLASVIQQETPLPEELPKIAAVYENRLALGMRLQADPTVIFAASGGAVSAGAEITRADLANPSPYNTYTHDGLPPGPICAPGLAAINAVLHPAASDDLFFVATGSGGHVFARSYQDQLANQALYRSALGD